MDGLENHVHSTNAVRLLYRYQNNRQTVSTNTVCRKSWLAARSASSTSALQTTNSSGATGYVITTPAEADRRSNPIARRPAARISADVQGMAQVLVHQFPRRVVALSPVLITTLFFEFLWNCLLDRLEIIGSWCLNLTTQLVAQIINAPA